MFPFNSSNTAEESAADTSKRSMAVKRRFSPAGSSLSRTTLLSATTRTRVVAEVEMESSRRIPAAVFDVVFEAAGVSASFTGAAGNSDAGEAVDCFESLCALYLRQP